MNPETTQSNPSSTISDAKSSTEEFLFKELKHLSDRVDGTENIPLDLKDRAHDMLNRLNRMAETGGYASSFDTLSRYVEIITSIPWGKYSTDKLDLGLARTALDKNHYGMEGVKERILEYLATMILLTQRGEEAVAKAPVLLFVGLQGVGKTTLAISIAEALDRKFVRIAMGAIGSVLELRGRSKAYPEALPGQIINALIRSQVMNPVILLDEIEKASGQEGLLSDVMATLLEILDPNQNPEFRDHYLDYPVDLSKVLFICSANNTGTISTALMDRMEVIKMPSYTDNEKVVIAQQYLMPKILAKSGLREGELVIDPNLWPQVVRPFGYDTGIRSLGRTLEAIARKVAREIVEGRAQAIYINEQNLKYYLPQ
ncbi:MAG: AAA family ATPase [Patescibacteria group bacterium]|uniref:AAA family ATPase n=1 Tax=candidate division WWE3 bacterium TaxID=2053526 RepID=A0A955EED0_UNCKA|nr:AAA family ATPase [candidate division WWE3 bacterium]